jgi:CRP/FNR family transcriptional regulator, cyclic AMP receptor protein
MPLLGSRPVSIVLPRRPKAHSKDTAFDAKSFLHSAGLRRTIRELRKNEIIFTQGDPANHISYIQEGGVKLTVVNGSGKEAVIAVLGPTDFLGEGCLVGQHLRLATATAIRATTLLIVEKKEMVRVLHEEHELSDQFIAYMLGRNARVEADLIDQLFNSSEKRLARALLLLAHFGEAGQPQKTIPKISQETLAEIVGTTRSRVNFFMNKFRKLRFIEYDGEIRINDSLLSVVLHD